ncbi:MAG TPA: hypothetical protein VMZ53_08275 [Kofleriaceae bacterium]|nr:hypothetical protein [Kofleriaceae bacterium]
MKSLALCLALALASTGCFSTWVGMRVAGHPGTADESVREERVPQPGLREHLAVSLVGGRFKCTSSQQATDIVYHSGYRYGSRWKRSAAIMFVAEAALATAFYFSNPDDPSKRASYLLAAGFFAADAVGTGVIAFIPRKEIYREETIAVSTPVRDACPEGLSVQIASETYPIDAAGAVGELGETALAEWQQAANGELLVDFEGRTSPLRSDGLVQAAIFDVPAGTLAGVALSTAALSQ